MSVRAVGLCACDCVSMCPFLFSSHTRHSADLNDEHLIITFLHECDAVTAADVMLLLQCCSSCRQSSSVLSKLSLGGMQALEWALLSGDDNYVQSAVSIGE